MNVTREPLQADAAVHVVAGVDVFNAISAEVAAKCPRHPNGRFIAAEVAVIHAQQAIRGFLGAQLCRDIYGWGLRYDSGLQGFAIIASGREIKDGCGLLEDAEALARRWCAADPLFRYAWMWADERE